MTYNRWELDKELSSLKEQGFNEEQAYCIIACIERGEYEQDITGIVKRNTTNYNC